MGRPATPALPAPTSEDVCRDGCVSIDGAADLSSLSRDEIKRAIAGGELETFSRGRRVLIPRVALVKWLAAVRDRSIRAGTARNVGA